MQKKGNVVFDNDGLGRYSNFAVPNGSASQQDVDMEQILAGTSTLNPRDVEDAVKKLGTGEDVLSQLPMAEQPDQLATLLLPYQRQGLQWMLDHESPRPPTGDKVVQMWKKVGAYYTNIATNFSVSKPPEFASGGLLADDMGLGKSWDFN